MPEQPNVKEKERREERMLKKLGLVLLLSGCTIQATDVQLRADTARGFKNHEEAIQTLGKAVKALLEKAQEGEKKKSEVTK